MNDGKKKLSDQKKLIETLQKQTDEYLAGWKRCKADFENYKKQQREWAESFRVYATEEIIQDLIPVFDNFELAVNHIPQTPESKSWREGVSHTKKQLEEVLGRYGLKKIAVQSGDPFDPHFHECVEAQNDTQVKQCEEGNIENEKESLVVDKILRSGYLLGEKLIRPAQVTTKNSTE